MTQNIIEKAIFEQYMDFLNTYPIDTAYPNVTYDPVVGTSYIDITFFHGATQQASIGEDYRIRGLGVVQFSVNTQAGNGEALSREIIDELHEFFKVGTVCRYEGQNVRVEKFYLGTKSGSGDWFYVPVNISFRADIEN